MREVIVSEAQAAEHNRSIVEAKNALSALRGQLTQSHEEVSGHLQKAQLRFLQAKPLISLATGYTACEEISERQELELSSLVYRPSLATDPPIVCRIHDANVEQTVTAASSSLARPIDEPECAAIEDSGHIGQVNSSIELASHGDDADTVKELRKMDTL